MADQYIYPGEELELFECAYRWKRYFAASLRPYIKGKVLEVGAGIGDTTSFLINKNVERWVCLEPDEKLFKALQKNIAKKQLCNCTAQSGTLLNLHSPERFDTILYIDVLEHIEKDKKEIECALELLNKGGNIIILSPAFEALYSPFDKAIGHYRRYTKKSLRLIMSEMNITERKLFYLEVLGFFVLLLNKFFFKKKYPEKKNIKLWNKLLIPVSRVLDKITLYSFGKTIVGIWQKN